MYQRMEPPGPRDQAARGRHTHAALLERYAATQRRICYPAFFVSGRTSYNASGGEPPRVWRTRRGAGLTTVALRHGALTPHQRAALGEFRLQQFALCGWYDLEVIAEQELQRDPTLDHCPDASIHILVGTAAEHHILAYFCLHAAPGGPWRPGHAPRMDDRGRPLFPTEFDQCGPEVFASLPQLAAVPIDRVLELACLLSNRVAPSPLSVAALAEGFYTVSCLVRERDAGIEALIGHVDRDARRMVARLGIPVLYAPLAPPAPIEQDAVWTQDVLEPGRFWPFAIATADLHRHAGWFARLDAALDAPAADLRRTLVGLLGHPAPTAPRAFVLSPAGQAGPYFWTGNPLYTAEPTMAISHAVGNQEGAVPVGVHRGDKAIT
jgi:hypothetical protein